MRSRVGRLLAAVSCIVGTSWPARAQTASSPSGPAVRASLNCESCDPRALAAGIDFVEFVSESDADVVVDVRTAVSDEIQTWTFQFSGRRRFAAESRTLRISVAATATAAEIQRETGRILRLGLAEYAAALDSGAGLGVVEVVEQPRGPLPLPAVAQRDRWNGWIFSIGFDGTRTGEALTSGTQYDVNASANRVTENWKIRFSTDRIVRSNTFVLDEESMETVKSRRLDWNVNALVVRTSGAHWSYGLVGALVGSTFTNQDLSESLAPAVEFDVFPYRESSRRSLTLQYAAGPAHFRYLEQTIFGKVHETAPLQVVTASFGMSQPRGQAGGSLRFSQRFDAPEMNRVTGTGNLTFRIARGFSLIVFTSVSRIRDQFFLAKGNASEEQVLLRLRQLATGFSYATSFSFSYSFGSLANRTVNPRFSS